MIGPVRLAVVGAGHLGKIHARLTKSLSGIELVAVVDPMQASADAAAEEFGTQAFTDLGEIAGSIDAAIVATPTVTHRDVTTSLLGRGVHVLVEKPLTDDVQSARELVDSAKAASRVLQVGHVERFNPAFEVASSQITDPKFIETRRVGVHAFRSTDIGVVHDLMIHDIDLVLSLVNSRPVDVQAFGASVLGDSEDIAHATVRFENGCIANLVASRVSMQAERRLNAFTPTGFVGVDMQSGSVDSVGIGERLRNGFALSDVAPSERMGLREELFDGLMHHSTPAVPERNAILEEQRDFLNCIRTGSIPRVDGIAGLAALELAAQILDSIAAHQWDGSINGRIGPFGLSAQDILRDPRLTGGDDRKDADEDDESTGRRKAG